MSRSLNRVQLIGHLGKDPEVRTVGNGSRVANFSLATSRAYTDGSNVRHEKTEWHSCVAWNTKGGALADVVERFCRKGKQVYVEGEIEYRQYGREGQTRVLTEIRVRELILLGSGNGGQTSDGPAATTPTAPEPTPERAPEATTPPTAKSDKSDEWPAALEEPGDDLPF